MCSSMIISHYSMVMVIEALSDLLSGIDVVKCPYSPTDHETVSRQTSWMQRCCALCLADQEMADAQMLCIASCILYT